MYFVPAEKERNINSEQAKITNPFLLEIET